MLSKISAVTREIVSIPALGANGITVITDDIGTVIRRFAKVPSIGVLAVLFTTVNAVD